MVNPPLIALMLATFRRLPTSREQAPPIDLPGAILVTTALGALIFGLSYGQQHGFATMVAVGALVGAGVLAAGFLWTETSVAHPMLPLSIFSAPTRRVAVIAMVLLGAVLAGYVYFVSLYLQRVLAFSPIQTGLALVPSTLTVVATSTLVTRRLLARLSVKTVLLTALLLIAAGQLWLAQIQTTSNYATAVLPGLLLTALGIGLGLPTASIAITSGVQNRDQGLAGALFTTSQQTGAAVGLAILATAAAARTAHASDSLVAGYRLSFLVSTGIALMAGVLVAWQLRSAACQQELVRQQSAGEVPGARAESMCRRS